jgi:dTDP-4-amino-4,6-dideoxygalactose transaminase
MGNSWRMTEVGAVIGISQLNKINETTSYLQKIIYFYREELKDTNYLLFPETKCKPSGYKCVAFLDNLVIDKEEIWQKTKAKGIYLAREVYKYPLHLQPIFKEISDGLFPLANNFAKRHICLPLWRTMERKYYEEVVSFFKNITRLLYHTNTQ